MNGLRLASEQSHRNNVWMGRPNFGRNRVAIPLQTRQTIFSGRLHFGNHYTSTAGAHARCVGVFQLCKKILARAPRAREHNELHFRKLRQGAPKLLERCRFFVHLE
jgi:hypothetical protein